MKSLTTRFAPEDDPDFSDLVRSMLEAEGIKTDMVLVSNRADFEAALALEYFDLILADYSLTDYNGSAGITMCCINNALISFSPHFGDPWRIGSN
jgi:DNA-binding response OmpR family regulator